MREILMLLIVNLFSLGCLSGAITLMVLGREPFDGWLWLLLIGVLLHTKIKEGPA